MHNSIPTHPLPPNHAQLHYPISFRVFPPSLFFLSHLSSRASTSPSKANLTPLPSHHVPRTTITNHGLRPLRPDSLGAVTLMIRIIAREIAVGHHLELLVAADVVMFFHVAHLFVSFRLGWVVELKIGGVESWCKRIWSVLLVMNFDDRKAFAISCEEEEEQKEEQGREDTYIVGLDTVAWTTDSRLSIEKLMSTMIPTENQASPHSSIHHAMDSPTNAFRSTHSSYQLQPRVWWYDAYKSFLTCVAKSESKNVSLTLRRFQASEDSSQYSPGRCDTVIPNTVSTLNTSKWKIKVRESRYQLNKTYNSDTGSFGLNGPSFRSLIRESELYF